jgi:hypothetical protein
MDKAFESKMGSNAFIDAKKGIISDADVVKDARNAISTLQENRNAAFKAEIPALEQSKAVVDISPVKATVNKWVKNLKGTGTVDDGIDLSKSRAVQETASEISTLADEVKNWTDLTPDGLNTLRQRIGNINTTTPTSSKIAAEIAESIKEVIEPAVPGYRGMLGKYAKASETINEMQRALSLKDTSTVDSAIRKLIITMKDDKTFRNALLKDLDAQTAGDITAKVAGRAATPMMSGRLGTMATALAAGSAGAAYITSNPLLLGIMALASPKMATALARGLGITGRGLDAVLSRSTTPALTVQQLGQLAAQDNQEQ